MPDRIWTDAALDRLHKWRNRLMDLVTEEIATHGPPEIEPADVDLAVREAVAKFFEEE